MHDRGPMNFFWSHFHGGGDEMGVWFVVGVMVVFSMTCIYFPLDIDKKNLLKRRRGLFISFGICIYIFYNSFASILLV